MNQSTRLEKGERESRDKARVKLQVSHMYSHNNIQKSLTIKAFSSNINRKEKVSYRHIWGWGTCWPGPGRAAGLKAGRAGSMAYFCS